MVPPTPPLVPNLYPSIVIVELEHSTFLSFDLNCNKAQSLGMTVWLEFDVVLFYPHISCLWETVAAAAVVVVVHLLVMWSVELNNCLIDMTWNFYYPWWQDWELSLVDSLMMEDTLMVDLDLPLMLELNLKDLVACFYHMKIDHKDCIVADLVQENFHQDCSRDILCW